MKIDGKHYRSIWPSGSSVEIIDQTLLPFSFSTRTLSNVTEVAEAIKTMRVRGAPLIGVSAAYGVALAMQTDPSDANLQQSLTMLAATRPTAINLRWALAHMQRHLTPLTPNARAKAAFEEAARMADEDVAINAAIGNYGAEVIAAIGKKKQGTVEILTHCNTGWIATVDIGTALGAIYTAHDQGVPLHVWASETRPRNQGALTAWELGAHGVPYTVIVDNAAGLLIQQGKVDICIVGTDRVTRNGDVCNKIGTYLKALACKAHGVPFYVALPSTTFDWEVEAGKDIPIEERIGDEILLLGSNKVFPEGSRAHNPAFDVTPHELVTGFITERGVVTPSELPSLFEEKAHGKAYA